MRTKTYLLTAATLLAGVAASMAQTVYSVNAVGYVNLIVKNGYNLISNPLNGTNNNLNTILPVAPADSLVLRWSKTAQSFSSVDTYFVLGDPALDGWYTPGEVKTTNAFNPGEAFFFKNSSGADATLTFVGEVPQGASLPNPITPLYGFYSSVVPRVAGFSTTGFPGRADMQYISWDPVVQRYVNTLTYFDLGGPDSGWYTAGEVKVDPAPGVGQGFLLYSKPADGTLAWTQTFSVN